MTDQDLKIIAKVLRKSLFNGQTIILTKSVIIRGKILYKFQTNTGQEMEIHIIDNQPLTMTISVTCYEDEYLDEGLGMMAGGNASTYRMTFNKQGPTKAHIEFV